MTPKIALLLILFCGSHTDQEKESAADQLNNMLLEEDVNYAISL